MAKPTAKKPNSSSPNNPGNEIRKHYYLERYVVLAPGRDHRPGASDDIRVPHTTADSSNCPFCHLKEPTILALPNIDDPKVRVTTNAFPALTLDNPKAYGVSEVVIDTPDHAKEFSSLPIGHIETILTAYWMRLEALKQVPGIRYVIAFKNDGPLSGASLSHAHSQVIALPLIPPHVETERDAINHYHDTHGSCAVCDLAAWELGEQVRVISSDSHLATIAPYAPEQPYEAWLIPKRHVGSLVELTQPELRAVAISLKHLTTKLDAEGVSFNFYVQESLPDQPHHLMIKVEPRLPRFYGGIDLATSVSINPVTPETTARWYQGHLK